MIKVYFEVILIQLLVSQINNGFQAVSTIKMQLHGLRFKDVLKSCNVRYPRRNSFIRCSLKKLKALHLSM
jgi:hypothetical protein